MLWLIFDRVNDEFSVGETAGGDCYIKIELSIGELRFIQANGSEAAESLGMRFVEAAKGNSVWAGNAELQSILEKFASAGIKLRRDAKTPAEAETKTLEMERA